MNIKLFIQEHYEELMEILNCVRVGIYIADGEGNTILLNDESEKTGGMSRKQLIGRNMKELIKIGYVEESSIIKVLNSGKEESIVQILGEGGHLYISGVPLIKNGKTELVICTERDITETINLKELLEKTEAQLKTNMELLQKQSIRRQGGIIAESKKMKDVIKEAMHIAKLDSTVMIAGESGTGKELMANLLYQNSRRVNKPYIKINCAAIPEHLLESEFFGYEKGAFTGADANGKMGIFELANGGTLFLDEIGELPIQMQPKLLRVIQEKEIVSVGGKKPIAVDVRIITATNVDLEEAIRSGAFREDLYYRLNVLCINIPPLRERKSDIRSLAQYFVEILNKQYHTHKVITPDGIRALEEYQWPGNVRQLRNVIERIMVGFDGNYISSFQVIKQIPNQSEEALDIKEENCQTLEQRMGSYEKKILTDALKKSENATKAAELLGINKSTISRKLKKYGIKT